MIRIARPDTTAGSHAAFGTEFRAKQDEHEGSFCGGPQRCWFCQTGWDR